MVMKKKGNQPPPKTTSTIAPPSTTALMRPSSSAHSDDDSDNSDNEVQVRSGGHLSSAVFCTGLLQLFNNVKRAWSSRAAIQQAQPTNYEPTGLQVNGFDGKHPIR